MRFAACAASAVAIGLAFSAVHHLPRIPRRARVDRAAWLRQAGIPFPPWLFYLAILTSSFAGFAVVVVLSDAPAVAIVPGILSALLPWAMASRRREQRLRQVIEAWPDGLRELIAAVTTGMALSQALAALARNGPPALQDAFAGYDGLAKAAGVPAALEAIRHTLADPTSDRIIEVLILAYERGGAVVGDILRDLAEATADDLRTAEAIATASLEQRINARAVFALPWAVLTILTARPGPFRSFYQTGGGLLVVALGAALSLVGLGIVATLNRQPLEPRVLKGTT